MNIRKTLTLMTFALLCLLLIGCGSRVITVKITNQSDGPIRNVEVSYNGGSYGVSSIAPGSTHQNRIKPFGPSTLQIEYLDSTGKKKTEIGPRLEKNDTGNIQLTVGSGKAQWSTALEHK
jgi:hypothetical protein